MTVKELIDTLRSEIDLQRITEDTEVLMANDPEGNGYGKATTPSLEANEGGPTVLVLWPDRSYTDFDDVYEEVTK